MTQLNLPCYIQSWLLRVIEEKHKLIGRKSRRKILEFGLKKANNGKKAIGDEEIFEKIEYEQGGAN